VKVKMSETVADPVQAFYGRCLVPFCRSFQRSKESVKAHCGFALFTRWSRAPSFGALANLSVSES
jgi:hypothetical protein